MRLPRVRLPTTPMRMKPRLGLGLLLALASGAMLFYIFAWATLSGGEFENDGAEWWRAVLGAMFRRGDPGYVTYAACVGLALGGFLGIHGLWSIVRGGGGKPTVRANGLDA